MIFSKELTFSDAQAVTATASSTNVIDLGANGRVFGAAADIPRDRAKGNPIDLLVQVVEDFATLTSLAFSVQSSDNEDFSGAPVEIPLSGAVPVASLVAGYRVPFRVLPEQLTGRYMRLRYTVAGSNATAGRVTAGVVMSVQTNG